MRLRIWLVLALAICVVLPSNASIIKRPPVKSTEVAYKDLPCSEQDKARIIELVSTVAESSKLSLLFNQSHLKEIGSQINHVHPMKFLSIVFSNPHLKGCMFFIWDDYFKRTEFMDGLGASLSREADKGKLLLYLDEFAAEIGASAGALKTFIDVRDWDNLVLYLIQS